MKKGFTLIELLAVIVILAIIALIATPIVLNIINDTKESAVLRSAEFYLDAVEISIANRILNGGTLPDGAFPIMEDGNICIKLGTDKCEDIMKVEVSKGAPTSGTIAFGEGQIAGVINLVIDNNYLYMNDEGNIEHMVYTENYSSENGDEYITINTVGLGEDEASYEYVDGNLSVDLILPPILSGKTMVGVCCGGVGGAFKNIILPDTIKRIEQSGISNNTAKTLILPKSVEVVTEGAIHVLNAENIYLNEGLKQIYYDGIQSDVLTKITIPSTVTNLADEEGHSVFAELPNLTTIVNRTDRAFDWNLIIGGTSGEPFKYGTARRSDGTEVSIIPG